MERKIRKPIEILVGSTGIRLKQFTVSDSQAIFELIDNNREHLS